MREDFARPVTNPWPSDEYAVYALLTNMTADQAAQLLGKFPEAYAKFLAVNRVQWAQTFADLLFVPECPVGHLLVRDLVPWKLPAALWAEMFRGRWCATLTDVLFDTCLHSDLVAFFGERALAAVVQANKQSAQAYTSQVRLDLRRFKACVGLRITVTTFESNAGMVWGHRSESYVIKRVDLKKRTVGCYFKSPKRLLWFEPRREACDGCVVEWTVSTFKDDSDYESDDDDGISRQTETVYEVDMQDFRARNERSERVFRVLPAEQNYHHLHQTAYANEDLSLFETMIARAVLSSILPGDLVKLCL